MDVTVACFDQQDRTTAPAVAERPIARPASQPATGPELRKQVLRTVLWWSTPDSKHPFFKDLHLDCGHVLVHRPMKKGQDGRFHIAKRVRCPCCADGVPVHAKRLPGFAAPQTVSPTTARATVTLPVEPTPQVERRVKITTAWSPRDLAARNWD